MSGTDDPRNDGPLNDGPASDEAAQRAREDAEWRAIVDHYGDQPDFEPDLDQDLVAPEPEEQVGSTLPAELGPRSWEPAEDDDTRYVPPPPPPVPRPHGLRLVAWLGLFGVPAVVLVCIVLNLSLPSPLGFLALVWFVGGFGYLVATMNGPRDPDGGWDDGAVV